MTETAGSRPGASTARTWEDQVAGWLALPPPVAAVGCAGLLFAGLATCQWLDPMRDADPVEVLRIGFVLSLLIGYMLAVYAYLPRRAMEDLLELRASYPQLTGEAELEPFLQVPRLRLRWSRVAGALGALGGLALVNLSVLQDPDPAHLELAYWWSLGRAWLTLMCCLLGWVGARAAFFTLVNTRSAADLTGGELEIDLLNLRPLRILGRMALRQSLLWIVGLSILSLLVFEEDAGRILPVLLGVFAVASLALLLPLRDIQRRVRKAKDEELARIDGLLREERAQLLHEAAAGQGRLQELLGYRSHIESLREWPFDTSVLLRFGLYLLIPLLSWLGGAFTERLLDAMLD